MKSENKRVYREERTHPRNEYSPTGMKRYDKPMKEKTDILREVKRRAPVHSSATSSKKQEFLYKKVEKEDNCQIL